MHKMLVFDNHDYAEIKSSKPNAIQLTIKKTDIKQVGEFIAEESPEEQIDTINKAHANIEKES